MKFDALDGFHPRAWPTHEEYLDVYWRSIAATCRAVVAGTVPCRSLGDASHARVTEYELTARRRAGSPNPAAKLRTESIDTRTRERIPKCRSKSA